MSKAIITKDWSRPTPFKHHDQIESSSYTDTPQFRPSYENEPVNMFMLMSMEYARAWAKEVEETHKTIMKKGATVFLQRSYVIRGLLKKRNITEAKKEFKMKQFENIPPKVKIERCPLNAQEHSAEAGKNMKNRGTETGGGPVCDGDTCTIPQK